MVRGLLRGPGLCFFVKSHSCRVALCTLTWEHQQAGLGTSFGDYAAEPRCSGLPAVRSLHTLRLGSYWKPCAMLQKKSSRSLASRMAAAASWKKAAGSSGTLFSFGQVSASSYCGEMHWSMQRSKVRDGDGSVVKTHMLTATKPQS